MTLHTDFCPVDREHSEPRWDRQNDAFDPPAELWAPGCGHAVCLAEQQLHDRTKNRECSDPTRSGWGCPLGECRSATLDAPCELEAGHDGPHLFGATPAAAGQGREA